MCFYVNKKVSKKYLFFLEVLINNVMIYVFNYNINL